jgi:predicted nucleic acid-binding protein
MEAHALDEAFRAALEGARLSRIAFAYASAAQLGERALSLQNQLTRRAHSGAANARDLVVAATALEHNLSVLHYRRVFELLGELCDLDQHPVAPLGSLS